MSQTIRFSDSWVTISFIVNYDIVTIKVLGERQYISFSLTELPM